MNARLSLIAIPALLTCFAALGSEARTASAATSAATSPERTAPPTIYHPHFKKMLECRISSELTITIRYQTVTFNAEAAKKMKPGQAWHLAGATIETSSELDIGGEKVAPGTYALSVMKAKDDKWALTVHKGGGFSRPGSDAQVLKTDFKADAPLFEHMNIDVQPSGDKKHTSLHLDVHFDHLLASSLITVPARPSKNGK